MQKLLAALLLALLPVAALAQSAPAKLPANSVYGRLGIPGDTGPGQAIPFTVLGTKLSGALSGGVAKMFPHLGQTTSASDCYTLIDPYGNPIACTTSTTTQGLQEFLTATTSNGWPAEVACQGTQFPSKTEPIFIEATTSVNVPVAQDWSFHSYGCNLNFNVTTVPGLIVDSQGASVFDWDGKIVYNVSGSNGNTDISPSCVVMLRPHTNTADGFAGIYAGYFRIKSPVANPQDSIKASGVICTDSTNGNVIQQALEFTEVNGGGAISAGNAYHGFFVTGTAGARGFQQNQITLGQVHGFSVDGVNAGFNSGNNINGNLWHIGSMQGNVVGRARNPVQTWRHRQIAGRL